MELLHKEDIEILDAFLVELLKTGNLVKSPDYIRYFDILKDWNLINNDSSVSSQDDITLISNGEVTERFVREGGFKKMYEKQLQNEKDNELLRNGKRAEATNSIWTKKTFWLTFGIALAGWIIAFLQYINCH